MNDFNTYDLIIDARSPREFEEDHIPGAVNLPVVNNDEFAAVGTLHAADPVAAYRLGASYSLRNVARHLEEAFDGYGPKSRILVYCFRGGKRSRVWLDVLDTIGYRIERLKGGWKAYRRWVNEQLVTVPCGFRYHVVSGPTSSGKTRLLLALREVGAQVLDLEGIARHRGSVLGALPDTPQPTQKMFDSLLLDALGKLDTSQPVWVEAESKKIGNVQLPVSLLDMMRNSATFTIETAMAQRVMLCCDDYRHFALDPAGMMERLGFLRALVGGAEFAEWEALAASGDMAQLSERLMRNHYDPAYRRSILRNYPSIDASPVIALDDLSSEGLRKVAQQVHAEFDPVAPAVA